LNSLDFDAAVISLETFYSFQDITDKLNKVFAFKDNLNSKSKIVTIPTGSYEIANIASEIKRQVRDDVNNNMALARNDATLEAVFKLGHNYRIHFTQPSSNRSIVGFDARIVG